MSSKEKWETMVRAGWLYYAMGMVFAFIGLFARDITWMYVSITSIVLCAVSWTCSFIILNDSRGTTNKVALLMGYVLLMPMYTITYVVYLIVLIIDRLRGGDNSE